MSSNLNYLVLLLILLFASNFTYSQGFYSGLQLQEDIRNNSLSTIDENTKGSPYLNEDFLLATIAPLGQIFMVRYDAVKDQMEVDLKENGIFILDKSVKEYVITFKNDGKKYVLLSDIDKTGYFVEIRTSEKLSLLKKESKVYNPKVEVTLTYYNVKPAYFSDLKVSYYIKLNNNESNLLEFSTNKNSLIKLFPKFKNDIKSYIKDKKIDLKDEKDIIKVFEFLNDSL